CGTDTFSLCARIIEARARPGDCSIHAPPARPPVPRAASTASSRFYEQAGERLVQRYVTLPFMAEITSPGDERIQRDESGTSGQPSIQTPGNFDAHVA